MQQEIQLPVQVNERADILDILRGFALLGIADCIGCFHPSVDLQSLLVSIFQFRPIGMDLGTVDAWKQL